MDAEFVDAGRRPLRARLGDLLAETLRSCAPHAEWLRCVPELVGADRLAARPGALRQRAVAARPRACPASCARCTGTS